MPDTFLNDATELPAALANRRSTVQDATALCIGIVWHPDPTRIGMIAPMIFRDGDLFSISRHEPAFRSGNGRVESPLADRHVSRQPLMIRRINSRSLEIIPPDSRMAVSVNGRQINQPVTVSLDELGEDVVICLSDAVILSVFETVLPLSLDASRHGLIGVSKGLQRAWALVRQAAPTNLPVLLTGATGTGKELFASAIHALSPRSSQKLHTVNMASLSASLGHAELFGATAGAYTGATAARTGLFAQAHGGTLFMDEIGDAPREVQPMLLRALENGEYRRLGDTKNQIADVRVITATDRSLEDGDFNQPLRHRLQGVVIRLAPLCERRVDIGLLLRHFLTRAEANLNPCDPATVSASQVLPLLLHPWPGNIRELTGAARQMRMGVPVTLSSRPPAAASASTSVVAAPQSALAPTRKHRDPTTVTDDEVAGALEATGRNIKAAATLLNVSRTSLYRLMERSPAGHKAGEAMETLIKDGPPRRAGDMRPWAGSLKIPRDSIKRHLRRSDMQ